MKGINTLAKEYLQSVIDTDLKKRLLEVLVEGEKSGVEIREKLHDVSIAQIYHNLSVLKHAKLITSRKEWRDKYYSIAEQEYTRLIREFLQEEGDLL